MKKGFTLVELAMVISFIALLFIGVLAGDKLIVQSKLRSIMADIADLRHSNVTFFLTYRYYPGDLDSAQANFGSTDIANGNADGIISSTESRNSIMQLKKAGLLNKKVIDINDYYSAVTNSTFTIPFRFTKGSCVLMESNLQGYLNGGSAPGQTNADMVDPMLIIGVMTPDQCNQAMLTVIQMRSLDQKNDDGKPYTGSIRVRLAKNTSVTPNTYSWHGTAAADCVDDGGDGFTITDAYNTDGTGTACNVLAKGI